MGYIDRATAIMRFSEKFGYPMSVVEEALEGLSDADVSPSVKHGYLEEIGVKADELCALGTTDKDWSGGRFARFMEERARYGFDSRETWSLDYTAACWLYEHLRMYIDQASKIVNLSFYKFDVSKVVVDYDRIFNLDNLQEMTECVTLSEPETMTQRECIDLMLEYLRDYIQTDERQHEASNRYVDYSWAANAQEYIDEREAQQAIAIFSLILHVMWW